MALFAEVGAAQTTNLVGALIEAADADAIENWEEIALLTLARLRAEITQLGGDDVLEVLVSRLAAHKRITEADISTIDFGQAVIPSIFNIAGNRLSLFTTLAQFGTVQDVAASEIRVELMFPTDETTRRYFNQRKN